MGNFEGLEVWRKSKDLCVMIYNVTSSGDFARDFDLRSQIRRSAISIPSNIAEGDESGSVLQCIRYFHVAKGSSAELRTQAIIAKEVGYVDNQSFDTIYNEATQISRMLERLIQIRSNKQS